MDIDNTRRENARALARECGSLSAFARRIDRAPAQVSHLIGKNPHKNIGRVLARQIEGAFNKPRGWLDQPHSFDPAPVMRAASIDRPPGLLRDLEPTQPPAGKRDIPIISWANASFDLTSDDFLQPGDAIDWITSYDGQCSRFTYALIVRGESMWPDYFDGDVIIVDPEVAPEQGRDVIVRNAETDDVTLKRFVQEGTRGYLKAVNRDYPEPIRLVTEWDRFCGVVIDQRRKPRWRR